MLTEHDPDTDASPAALGLGQRVLLALPRLGGDRPRRDLGQWMRTTFLKPVDPHAPPVGGSDARLSTEDELRAQVKAANDKERTIGLLAAPLAAAIGILVLGDLVAHDPATRLASGALNPRHVSASLYNDLTLVLLGLSLVMLVTAWFRKRLYLGMAMALYGLAIFNLHFWGFGVPFIMCASWLLVRSYRLQRDLLTATGELPGRSTARTGGGSPATRPGANKRYTPPTAVKRVAARRAG